MRETDHPRVTPVSAEVIAPRRGESDVAHRSVEDTPPSLRGRRLHAGNGTAHCHPADTNVPEIGDEPAAGRS
ncbi:dsRBD fold-containing protein [Streptomyces sp. NPDC101234]|uniref:dsRBD fold-containing protein n=1 Tax=Streptomyces sp. NPDC101234 TaxID=3366138 RepID=UPI00380420A5